MNHRRLIIGTITVILLLAVAWWRGRSTPLPPAAVASSLVNQASRPSLAQASNIPLAYEVPMKGKYQGMNDPRWEWWRRMEKLDPRFEWKMPIKFYGKIVDQDNQPVPGARIRYGWNNTNGSNERFDESDAGGVFSIEGIQGKILSVRIQKEGYYALNSGFGAFEYAAFFEPHFHEPDPNNPVIFQMLKKQKVQPLVMTDQEIKLPRVGSTATVRLDDTTLEVSLLANQVKPNQPWSMHIVAIGGGLQTTKDEFPVKAPIDGYQSSVTVDNKSQKPPNWSGLYQGCILYVKTAKGYYGRVEIKMLAGDNKAQVTTYLNPLGFRSLESHN